MFTANVRVNILRGSGTDDYGDPRDLDVIVESGISASIVNVSVNTSREDEDVPQDTTVAFARLYSSADIQAHDRIQEIDSGYVWIIDSVQRGSAVVNTPPVKLVLRRTV